MRLKKHPILKFDKKKKINILYEGEKIESFENETIVAALHAAGKKDISESYRLHKPRGLFCAIGKCASCVMEVNGVPNTRTCMVPVQEGMEVKKQINSIVKEEKCHNMQEYEEPKVIEKDFVIIGGGPAGLSAAIYCAKLGVKPLIIEENFLIGGQLIKQTHKFFGSRSHYAGVRGIDIANILIKEANDLGVEIWTSSSVIGYYPEHVLGVIKNNKYHKIKAKNVLVATGASEKSIPFPGNDLPGVYGAGAIQTLMNVYGIEPGKKVLVIGAGNIGVIVAYQLLQAGVEVVAVCEAMPRVGAYIVHSAKLKRLGVPIYTSHTISKVWGEKQVEGAQIYEIDKNWNKIPGSEKDFDIDTVALSVGLSPSVELLAQAGAKMTYIPELGGNVALHDKNMETSIKGIYLAGDIACIEEASAAMMEGRIAGICVAEKLNGINETSKKYKKEVEEELISLREGPFGEKVRQGNKKLYEEAKKHGLC